MLSSRYILSIESAEEIEEYLIDLLQGADGKKRHFIDQLLSRWKRTQRSPDPVAIFPLKESLPFGKIKKISALFIATCTDITCGNMSSVKFPYFCGARRALVSIPG